MKAFLLASTCALGMLAADTAAAQSAPASQSPTETADSPSTQAPAQTVGAVTDATAANASEQNGLEDIVVTAQRRVENLQRAAIAVSAVSGDALVSAGITETSALSRLVPSLQIQPTGGSGTSFFLRGVGTLQSNAFGENPIAFNYNGVYVARPTGPVGAFYDLERVEVVKGPQGTLYGRNATGGAINVLPKRPRLREFGGDATVELGNYGRKAFSGALNVPLGASAALRVAGQIVDRDGFLSDGYSDEKGEAARISFLFKPAGSDWSAALVADYFHQGGRGLGGVLAPGSAFGNPSGYSYPGYAAPALSEFIGASDPRSIAALAASPPPAGAFLANGFIQPPLSDGFNDSSFYGLSATVEGDVGFGTLTVIPAYRRAEPRFRFYFTGFEGNVDETSDQTSLEVRLSSRDDQRLRYVVGGYYFREEQEAFNQFYQGRISDTQFNPDLETKSKAIFGQFTFDVTGKLRLVAGGRYTDEEKSLVGDVLSGGPFGPPSTANVQSALKFSKFTWKAGVEADIGPASLLYANIATGFKAGGFFVGAANNTFQPEELTAFTVGSKNRFLANRLQINLEAFYWKYRDQQISFVGPVQVFSNTFTAGGTTVNAGNARFFGVEAELQFAPTRNDVFSANVLYNNTKYNSLNFIAISAGGGPLRSGCAVAPDTSRVVTAPARLFAVDCEGRPGLNAPKWSGTVSYEHTFNLSGGFDLVLGARSRLSSSYYTALDYLPEQRENGFTQTDAFLTLQGPDNRWSLSGFVNNIEDSTVINGSVSRPVLQTVYVTLAPPRTYGVRASLRF